MKMMSGGASSPSATSTTNGRVSLSHVCTLATRPQSTLSTHRLRCCRQSTTPSLPRATSHHRRHEHEDKLRASEAASYCATGCGTQRYTRESESRGHDLLTTVRTFSSIAVNSFHASSSSPPIPSAVAPLSMPCLPSQITRNWCSMQSNHGGHRSRSLATPLRHSSTHFMISAVALSCKAYFMVANGCAAT